MIIRKSQSLGQLLPAFAAAGILRGYAERAPVGLDGRSANVSGTALLTSADFFYRAA
jgi:hypothetical protein